MIKIFFRTCLRRYLRWAARIHIWRFRPVIIAIAGSHNKTFVKNAIIRRLGSLSIPARGNPRSYNTDIGLPLAILGLTSGYDSYQDWWHVVWSVPRAIWKKEPASYLVLEYGISRPGDMSDLLGIAQPDIYILTEITQRYLNSFDGMDELVSEYSVFARSAETKGEVLVYNADNRRINDLFNIRNGNAISIGIKDKADFQAINISKDVDGLSLDIAAKGRVLPCHLRTYGEHNIYAELFAIAVEGHVKAKTAHQL